MADEVATRAFEMGADKVFVNNGGDVALKMVREKQTVVGIKPPHLNKIIGRLHVSGKALDRGSDAAKKLYRKNLIRGCLIVVKSDSSLLDPEGIIEYPTEIWA